MEASTCWSTSAAVDRTGPPPGPGAGWFSTLRRNRDHPDFRTLKLRTVSCNIGTSRFSIRQGSASVESGRLFNPESVTDEFGIQDRKSRGIHAGIAQSGDCPACFLAPGGRDSWVRVYGAVRRHAGRIGWGRVGMSRNGTN